MKVVQINAVYGIGSTGTIVQDICNELIEQNHKAFAFWGTACRNTNESVELIRIGNTLDHKIHALLRRISGIHGNCSKLATRQACKKILEISPDVVHLHNLHSNYINLQQLLCFLAKHNIPTLITLHDCWFFTGGCMHYYGHSCEKWKTDCKDCPANHRNSDIVLEQKKNLFSQINRLYVNGVSEWTTEAAKNSYVLNNVDAECVFNGIDTDVFTPQNNTEETRRKYGIPRHHKLVLGVSQGWSINKGLNEFIMLSDRLKDKATIILVGKDNGVPKRENLRCIGFTSNQKELIDLYSAADLFVNPSRMETFGLVTAEAMACGTPVVAYNNTGSAEIVNDNCGMLVDDGDASALVNAVEQMLKENKENYSDKCVEWVKNNFNKESQINKYIELYERIAAFNS